MRKTDILLKISFDKWMFNLKFLAFFQVQLLNDTQFQLACFSFNNVDWLNFNPFNCCFVPTESLKSWTTLASFNFGFKQATFVFFGQTFCDEFHCLLEKRPNFVYRYNIFVVANNFFGGARAKRGSSFCRFFLLSRFGCCQQRGKFCVLRSEVP